MFLENFFLFLKKNFVSLKKISFEILWSEVWKVGFQGMYSFCQLMTASMPTFIGRNITGIRPTHDCFYANLGHIMTADWLEWSLSHVRLRNLWVGKTYIVFIYLVRLVCISKGKNTPLFMVCILWDVPSRTLLTFPSHFTLRGVPLRLL